MKACKHCGLSIGDTATFCPVCCTLVDPEDPATEATAAAAAAPAPAAPTTSPQATSEAGRDTPADLEAEARACEKSDPARAAALYRQAIVDRLEADDALDSQAGQRDVQRLFDRLSLVLKRDGRADEALEEIDAAAYLGLVDGAVGTKAQREALAKRREALRCVAAKPAGAD